MADHFYGLNKGDSIGAVQVGTVTAGTNVELRTRDGTGLTKTEVIRALEVLKGFFTTTNELV